MAQADPLSGTTSATVVRTRRHHRSLHEELELIQTEKNSTVESFAAKKWSELFRLHILLTNSKRFGHISLGGDGHGLYEHLYRAFPQQMVTKPRLIGVLRTVCGIEATKLTSMDDESKALVKHLEGLHYCFESTNVHAMTKRTKDVATLHANWRLLLLSLKMLREPMLPESAYFWFGFQLFSSPGLLDDSPELWITRHDLYNIFNFAASSHVCSRVINQRIAQADHALPESVLNRSRIHYRHFCELQDHPILHQVLEPATPYTTYFIELMSPHIRHFLFQMRKFDKDRAKCRKFLSYYHAKTMRFCWSLWLDQVKYRRNARRTVLRAMDQAALRSRFDAFDRLRSHALKVVAATEIQRVFRGMQGRRRFLGALTTLQAVLTIQRLYRDRDQFHKFVKLAKLKSKHAIKIQRVYRGRLGRIRARARLLAYFDSEMAKIEAQREACAKADRVRAARQIQRTYRKHKTKLVAKQTESDNQDYHRIEMEMKIMLQAAERARDDHRAAVMAYYDKLREDTEAIAAREIVDARERQKVIVRRREREWATIMGQRKAKLESVAASKLERKATREAEWRAKIESRAQARRDKLLQVLLRPNSKDDDVLKAAFLVRLDVKYRQVKANYKATGIAMAAKEMKDRAQHDVLLEEMEEERERARNEWRLLELQVAKQEQDDADTERRLEIERDSMERFRAATCIQRGAKVYLARKVLQRKVEHAFEKVYDVATGQVVYLNTRTKGVCSKPTCLGTHDLPMANKWYICPDITGDVYYYNPKTMRMSWTKPDECTFCDGCSTKFAAVYCPNHMKGRYVDPVHLCLECYAEQSVKDPGLVLNASRFDGATARG
ncbi:hypothetical protein H310_01309 [Aphanomyces invadans]|uniref:WW domain-containing protein n=1 Tax=Aphanomyces invadans TaxID=157072 RepID=A0A024UQR5_9STRA|nr:hypothetical protein H310_01309 [Aphanomyces invadans]ETW08796.1 hypothetical protein H310_01309 [Aphanomyces invadans]|eukprot:XP_008862601.1 hypothetical protein H310_01309 [Aphanomyces invadans]